MTVNNNNNEFLPFGAASGVVIPTMQSGSHNIEKDKHLRKEKLATWRKTLPNIPEGNDNSNNNCSSSSFSSCSNTTDTELSLSCSEDSEHTTTSAPPARRCPSLTTTGSGSGRWSLLSKSVSFRGIGGGRGRPNNHHSPAARPEFFRSNSSRSIRPSNPIITSPNHRHTPPVRPTFSSSKSSRSLSSNPIPTTSSPNHTPANRTAFSRSKSSRSIPLNPHSSTSCPNHNPSRPAFSRSKSSLSLSSKPTTRSNISPNHSPARPAFSRSKSSRSLSSKPITSNRLPPQIRKKTSNLLPVVEHPTPTSSSSLSPSARPVQEFDFKLMLEVSTSWSKIKQSSSNYREILGEQIILKMMELNPRARSLLQLESIRAPSTQFVELSLQLINFIDVIVGWVGPDMEEYQNDIIRLGEKYHHIRAGDGAGIMNKELFRVMTESICAGLQYYLKDAFTNKTKEAWTSVLGYVITTMESSEDIVYV